MAAQLESAVDDLSNAVRLDPTSKFNANSLGEAYLIKGRYRPAIEYFNQAIARDAKYAAPYSGLCVLIGCSAVWMRRARLRVHGGALSRAIGKRATMMDVLCLWIALLAR